MHIGERKRLHMNNLTRMIVASGLAAGLAACGGSGGAGSGSGTTATDETGTAIRTSDGKTVNVTAHEKWTEGVKLFEQAEKSGWSKDACGRVIDKFEDAVSAQPKFAEAVYMQGLVKYKCGDKSEALGLYNKALGINPKLCKARVGVGLDKVEKGSSGRGDFERSIRDDPQCTEGYVNLAISQRKEGQNAEALNNLRRALAIDAQYLPAFNEMALLYLSEAHDNKKKLDLAEVVCSQAQKIDKDYAPVYNTWGLIDLRRNKIIEASAKFQQAFQLDGKMFEAYMNFGQITIGFRGYDDARAAFEKALELRPKSFEAQIGLGVALRGLEQNDKAIAAYEKARDLDPSRPEPYYNLGVLWQDFQDGTEADMSKAEKYYQEFLSKAGGEKRFDDAIQDVTRKCADKPKRRGRKGATKCIAGRLQNIANYRQALKDMAEMEALQKQAEAEAAAMEAEEKAAQEAAAAAEAEQGEAEGKDEKDAAGAEGGEKK